MDSKNVQAVTLATLHLSSPQQVFDQVVSHLLAQRKKSQNKALRCLYLNSQGLMCAAGCLIGDDDKAKELDAESSSTWDELINLGKVPSHHGELIHKLQRIHDGYDVRDWAIELRVLADIEGLEYKF